MFATHWGVHARTAPATRVVVKVAYPAAVVESGVRRRTAAKARPKPKMVAEVTREKKTARLYAGSPSARGLQPGFHVAVVVREENRALPRWECAQLVGSDGPRDRWRVRFEHNGEVAAVELPQSLRRLTWEYSSQFPRDTFRAAAPVFAENEVRPELALQARQQRKAHAAAAAAAVSHRARSPGEGGARISARALDLAMVCKCTACGGDAPPLVYDRSAPSSLVELRGTGSGAASGAPSGALDPLAACRTDQWQVSGVAVPAARRAFNGGAIPGARPVIACYECLKDAAAASRYVWDFCAKHENNFWGAHPNMSCLASCVLSKDRAPAPSLKAAGPAAGRPGPICRCALCDRAAVARRAYVDEFKLELAAYVGGARAMRLLNATVAAGRSGPSSSEPQAEAVSKD
jgi:hypothetical protein